MLGLSLGLGAAGVLGGILNNQFGTKEVTKFNPATSFFGDPTRAGSVSGVSGGFDFDPNEYTTTEQTGFGKAMNIIMPTLNTGMAFAGQLGGTTPKASTGMFFKPVGGRSNKSDMLVPYKSIFAKKGAFIESNVIRKKGDPWEYKREGNKFFTRKIGSKGWITPKGKSLDAIKGKIYNISEENNNLYNGGNLKGVTISADKVTPNINLNKIIDNTPLRKILNPSVNKLQSNTLNDIPINKKSIDISNKNKTNLFTIGNSINKNNIEDKAKGNRFNIDTSIVKKNSSETGINYYYVIDKPTRKVFKGYIGSANLVELGEVGIGKNIGDRDVSGGRKTGIGTNMTQSGWVRINRESKFNKRNKNYGDEFHGFESLTNNGNWIEIPTGIHGTEHVSKGRVSGGCTRMNCELEKKLKEDLKPGVMLYYTDDEKGKSKPSFRQGGFIEGKGKKLKNKTYVPDSELIDEYDRTMSESIHSGQDNSFMGSVKSIPGYGMGGAIDLDNTTMMAMTGVGLSMRLGQAFLPAIVDELTMGGRSVVKGGIKRFKKWNTIKPSDSRLNEIAKHEQSLINIDKKWNRRKELHKYYLKEYEKYYNNITDVSTSNRLANTAKLDDVMSRFRKAKEAGNSEGAMKYYMELESIKANIKSDIDKLTKIKNTGSYIDEGVLLDIKRKHQLLNNELNAVSGGKSMQVPMNSTESREYYKKWFPSLSNEANRASISGMDFRSTSFNPTSLKGFDNRGFPILKKDKLLEFFNKQYPNKYGVREMIDEGNIPTFRQGGFINKGKYSFNSNSPMNKIAAETANEYFNNPNNNLILPTARQINSIKAIKGKSHEQGGVDKVINGKPVEVEGGEFQFNFKDGSKAVFNKEQMEMYEKGISINEIIATMPKENVMAKTGMFIKKKAQNGFYSANKDYSLGDYPGKGFNFGVDSDITANFKIPNYPSFGEIEYLKTDKGDIPQKDSPINFFDQYKKNLTGNAIGAGALQLGQAFQTISDMNSNLSEEPPKPVDLVRNRNVTPRFVNPETGLQSIDRSFNSALNLSKTTGRPELIPQLLGNKFKTTEKLMSDVNQLNTRIGSQADQFNVQTGIRTDFGNAQISRQNELDKLKFDSIKAQVRGGNIDSLYKSLAGMFNTSSQFGQNKLSSDIMEYLKTSLAPTEFNQLVERLMSKQGE